MVAFMEASTVTGPAKNLLRFCRLARDRSGGRCQVSILTAIRSSDSSSTNPFVEAASAAGVEIDVIRERHRFDLGVLPQMRKILAKREATILQTHGIKSHFLARLGRTRGLRWIAYHHGYTAEDLKMRAYNGLNRFLLPAADLVVTVCEAFRQALTKEGVRPDRIRVLPNSIEARSTQKGEESAAELRKRAGLRPESRVILSVGRLSAEKGHAELIEAMEQIASESNEDLQLLLLGDGPEREALIQKTRLAGLQDKVSFAGHTRNPLPYYSMAGVFVLPSHSEGSPNVLLEAMAAQTPIVACAVGGVPEMLRDEETALLPPPRDPAALRRAILRVLNDADLSSKLRRNALHDVVTRHAPETYCDSLRQVYDELLGPARMAARELDTRNAG